jgi:hypothetical protein
MNPDFSGWLQKGLGRAPVFLQANDSRPYRDVLLHACTHNLAYDRQCEDTRAAYLVDLINFSRDAEYYRDGIHAALIGQTPDEDDTFCYDQIFELAAHCAAQGDAGIKQSMYAAFERLGFANAGVTCAQQLVQLDGEAGLIAVCRSFDQVEADDRPWQFGSLLDTLEKREGKRLLPTELSRFVEEWRENEARYQHNRAKGPPTRNSYAEINDRIRKKGRKAGSVGWSKKATDEEIGLLAEDLLSETDGDRLYGFLRMFQLRKFPRGPERLLDLARSSDDGIAHAAMAALVHFAHPEIRKIALGAATNSQWMGLAIKMLTLNRGVDDFQTIEGLLRSAADADTVHDLGWGFRHFREVNKSADAEPSLLLLYEEGPCVLCRHAFVTDLIAIDRFPDRMGKECLFDADSETRKLVDQTA